MCGNMKFSSSVDQDILPVSEANECTILFISETLTQKI